MCPPPTPGWSSVILARWQLAQVHSDLWSWWVSVWHQRGKALAGAVLGGRGSPFPELWGPVDVTSEDLPAPSLLLYPPQGADLVHIRHCRSIRPIASHQLPALPEPSVLQSVLDSHQTWRPLRTERGPISSRGSIPVSTERRGDVGSLKPCLNVALPLSRPRDSSYQQGSA